MERALELAYQLADRVLSTTQMTLYRPLNAVSDFFESVTWSEPFIVWLLLAQALLLAFVLLVRRRPVAQIVLSAIAGAVVLAGEPLNRQGRKHWSRFATQNYFDHTGLFMSVFVSAPLLICMNIVLVQLGLHTMQLAIKTQRLRRRAAARTAGAAPPADSADARHNGHKKNE